MDDVADFVADYINSDVSAGSCFSRPFFVFQHDTYRS